MSNLLSIFVPWGEVRGSDFFVRTSRMIEFLEFASKAGIDISGIEGFVELDSEGKIMPITDEIIVGATNSTPAESNKAILRVFQELLNSGKLKSTLFAIGSDGLWVNGD